MSPSTPAVFLSYASQDAAVVQRLAEALRTVGIEVWFDQSELRGGDAWDSKIKQQIRGCTLFVPIISAHTEARPEGYFRLEWKLAVDRSHLMSDDHPFLFPVVIDDTPDAHARVPDRFRERQWMRLGDRASPADIAARIQTLLRTDRIPTPTPPPPPAPRPSRRKATTIAGMAIGLTVFAFFVLRPFWWSQLKTLESTATPPPSPTSPVASEADQLKQRMAGIFGKYVNATEAEQSLAIELGEQLTTLAPTDADAWAAYSLALYSWMTNQGDRRDGPSPLEAAQRAIALNAAGFEPRLALGAAYLSAGSTRPEGAALLRTLAQERPDDERVLILLALSAIARDPDQALALTEQAAALPHPSPYLWVLRGLILVGIDRIDEAEAELQHSLSMEVTPIALMAQAYIQVFYRDNLETAAELVGRIPGSFLIRQRETAAYADLYLACRQPTKALERYRAYRGDWLEGSPKAYWIGVALAMDGRAEAAAVSWRAALAQVEDKLSEQPDDASLLLWQAQLRARLGETEQAAASLPLLRDLFADRSKLIQLLIQLGHHDEAIAALTQAWDTFPWHKTEALAERFFLFHSPGYDPLRADPRFQALVAKVRQDPRLPALPKP